MARLLIDGFETGAIVVSPIWSSGNLPPNIESTIVHSGAYSANCHEAAGGSIANDISLTKTGLNKSTLYVKFYYYLAISANPTSTISNYRIMLLETSGGTDIAQIQINVTTGGVATLEVRNVITGTNVITGISLSEDTWHLIEFKCVINSSTGVLEIKVDGNTSTASSQNTGSSNVDRCTIGIVTTLDATFAGDHYYDDVVLDDASYPGASKIICRQGNASPATYDSWTKSTGTDIIPLWDDTPVDETTYANSPATGDPLRQMVGCANFDSTQTGHGSETIGSSDTLNICQIIARAKRGSGSGRTHELRYETSGTNSNANVYGVTLSTFYAYVKSSLLIPDTASGLSTLTLLNTLEIGGMKSGGAGGQDMYIADIWFMVEYTPVSNVTTTQTINAKSRIQKVQSPTTTGKAAIRNTTTRTTQGRSRLQKAFQVTLQGLSRIQKVVQQALTGKAAIQNTTTRTIPARSRLQKTANQTVQGQSRIQKVQSPTIAGKSRIQKTISQTIQGRGRLQKTITQTINALARIVFTTIRTIQGLTRITATTVRTIQAVARIQKTLSQTTTAKSRIQKQAQQAISARSRIQKIVAATLNAISRITATTARTIAARARIQKSATQTINARSRIQLIVAKTLNAISRITKQQAQTILGRARVQKSQSRTIQAVARLSKATLVTIAGIARILKTQSQTIQGRARVQKQAQQTTLGRSRIGKIVLATILAKSRLLKASLQIIAGRARIQITVSQAMNGKARITGIIQQNIQGRSRISAGGPQQKEIFGISRILRIRQVDMFGKGRVQKAASQIINAKAKIVKFGPGVADGQVMEMKMNLDVLFLDANLKPVSSERNLDTIQMDMNIKPIETDSNLGVIKS